MTDSPHPDSRWTHPICRSCYAREQPDRTPARGLNMGTEVCCWCGVDTNYGIYYRADPAVVHPDSAA